MMKLIDVLSKSGYPMSLKELSQLANLHPSTSHRILNVLVHYRVIDKVQIGSYRLGTRLLELGNIPKTRIDIRKQALPFMQELHHQLQETVNLSIRQGDEMVYVERLAGDHLAIRVTHLIGAKAPLHVTAVGKLFLIEDGEDKTLNYIQRNGLKVFTKNTIKDSRILFTELAKIKKQGYAFDNEEAETGLSCIGAGIYDESDVLVAGLSISTPSHRLNRSWGKRVKATADGISAALGSARA
ncbi:MAG: IclR family transcriptional regulator [Proteobacteria bacterium]|nr:IclR family transcriptional regulator [Pseudomonadota bacterium]